MTVVAWTTFPEWKSRRLNSRKGSLIPGFMKMNCYCSAHPPRWVWTTAVRGELQWQLWDISAALHRDECASPGVSWIYRHFGNGYPQYKTVLPILPMFGSIHVCELSDSVSVWVMWDTQRKSRSRMKFSPQTSREVQPQCMNLEQPRRSTQKLFWGWNKFLIPKLPDLICVFHEGDI